MNPNDRVLVVLLNSQEDWAIARERHWYRLPLKHGPRDVTARWIAFYQPAAFGQERWGVYSYAQIREVSVVRRVDLFPHEPSHPRAQQHYHVIAFDPPIRLARPLLSGRGRRFVWTDTTWWRLTSADTLDEIFSPEPLPVAVRDQVLVGIVPRAKDLEIANRERWYRIPRALIEKWVTPGHVAFCLGHPFGKEAGTIRQYAAVQYADVVKRIVLFPDQPRHPRAQLDYIRLHIEEPKERSEPIRSRRPRRIVLLPTTWEQFIAASDINDLYQGDPEEEMLYGRITDAGLRPERAYYVRGTNAYYFTDYAFHCRSGNVQVDLEPPQDDPAVNRLAVARNDAANAPAHGWTALRLSRFDIARRPEEALSRVKSLVDANGGMIADYAELLSVPGKRVGAVERAGPRQANTQGQDTQQ